MGFVFYQPALYRPRSFNPWPFSPHQYFLGDTGFEDACDEAACYEALKPLQGGVIPALLGVSELSSPGAGLLVLELIEGRPLSELEEIMPEVAEAAVSSLAEVRPPGWLWALRGKSYALGPLSSVPAWAAYVV